MTFGEEAIGFKLAEVALSKDVVNLGDHCIGFCLVRQRCGFDLVGKFAAQCPVDVTLYLSLAAELRLVTPLPSRRLVISMCCAALANLLAPFG